jgi:hypothetical protein
VDTPELPDAAREACRPEACGDLGCSDDHCCQIVPSNEEDVGLLADEALIVGVRGAFDTDDACTEGSLLGRIGQVLLGILGVGLACHALWHFLRAAIETHGSNGETVQAIKRAGWAIAGVVNAFFAVAAFQTLIGIRGGGKSGSTSSCAGPVDAGL